VIAGYLNVQLYGAKGDGVTDDTAAIQNAINDAVGEPSGTGGYSMAVYFPPGTYLVSKTLQAIQIFDNMNNSGYGSINEYGGLLAPDLVGDPISPPTILLKKDTFTNASSPQPVIHVVNTPNGPTSACEDQYSGSTAVGCWDVLFNAVVRDLNVSTGSGNAGAIGIQFYSAQNSYMQNVNVTATGSYAGIQGSPATSVWTNVTVNGGQYGVIVDSTAGTDAFAGLTVSGQTVAGLSIGTVGAVVVTGFSIKETGGAAGVIAHNGTAQGTTLSMIDGLISVAGSQPAISNIGGDSVYLNNVYLQAPSSGQLIVNGAVGATSVAANGSQQLITEYSHVDHSTNPANDGYAEAGYIVINDVKQQADYGPFFGSGSAPGDLVQRHIPAHMPWAFDANIVWVTDYGADPTGFTDSTTQIQNAINAAHSSGVDEVFLPRGDYSISATLKLYPNTKFFGVPGAYARLFGFGWVTHGVLQPYLQVGDAVNEPAATAAGTAIVSDINFFMPTETSLYAPYLKLLPAGTAYSVSDSTYLEAIDWQTGVNSILNEVWVNYQYNDLAVPSGTANRVLTQTSHSGGGRWYGFQVAQDYGFMGAAGYIFLANGTSTPLTFYGANLEHMVLGGEGYFGLTNASNVRILGSKSEARGHFIVCDSCSNVMASGLNGDSFNGAIISGTSSNININTDTYFAEGSSTSINLIADNTASFPQADAYALYKLGNFNNGEFPTCSTGLSCVSGSTPTPTPTPTSTPTSTPTPTPSHSPSPTPTATATSGTSVSPNPAMPGQTIALTTSINPSVTASGTMVAFWYTDSKGVYLGGSVAYGSLVQDEPKQLSTTFTLPATTAPGTLVVTGAIYKAPGSQTVLENLKTITTFTVGISNPAPVISTQPASVAVTAGQGAGFSVVASGSGLSYQWKFNDATIAGATSASYSIASTTSANAGSYTVTISNSGGSVTSSAAVLTVNAVVYPATPSGSSISAGASGSLVDSKGNVWTIGSGNFPYENGKKDPVSGAVKLLLYFNGLIYQQASDSSWWVYNGGWGGVSADPRSPSANGSTEPSLEQLVDSSRNVWTIGATGGTIYKNGVKDPTSANVVLLLYYDGVIYQENSFKYWWSYNGTGWVLVGGDPRTED
jgi:hypothetical protein